MAGTKIGGLKASNTNRAKYGSDFFIRIVRLGGSVENPKKGFGTHRQLASLVGRKGGAISKRRPKI